MVLSENWTLVDPHHLRAVIELANIAEDCGVDTVMLSEHVVLGGDSNQTGPMINPRDYAAPHNQHPFTPWPDSIVLASAIAAATSTLRIALAAVITPLRHPLLLSKQLSTLDLLAEGRLVVQPTASWSEAEYQALGVDFRQRGAILDEQLEAIHSTFRAAPNTSSSHQGERFSYQHVWVEPRRTMPVNMWFGGEHLHDPLIRRLVTYGSGFHPFGTPTADELARLHVALRDAGRRPEDLELIGGIRGRFETPHDLADLDEALLPLEEKVAAGFRSICFKPSMFTDEISGVAEVCLRVVSALDRA